MKLGYTILYVRNKNTFQTVDCTGEPALKKAKTDFSAGKVKATVFWDSHGVILIDYLKKGKTIKGAYYTSLLDMLEAYLEGKRPNLQKRNIRFHQDNAPSHSSAVAIAITHELRFEMHDRPHHSPDPAPSDFFLFPNLNIALGGQIFVKCRKYPL
jgi:histone-lysine N-methyltransferase SETMAR